MNIYREEILDHFKRPRNFGSTPPEATRSKGWVKAKEVNGSCGDVMEMGLRIKAGKVEEVRFEGEGCAISMAASSMLTEMIKGKKVREVEKMTGEEMIKRLGIKISLGRKKCATLGLEVCQKAVKKLRK